MGNGGEFDVFALGGVDEGREGGVLADPAGGHQGTFGVFDDAPVLHGGFQAGQVVECSSRSRERPMMVSPTVV